MAVDALAGNLETNLGLVRSHAINEHQLKDRMRVFCLTLFCVGAKQLAGLCSCRATRNPEPGYEQPDFG